jgi:soluble lytic murein transglycosylase-like protein
MRIHGWLCLLFAAMALPGCAESVLLKNGFTITVDRHETEGDTVHLYLAGGGTADLRTNDIASFTPDPAPVKETAAPAPEAKPTPAPPQVTLDDLIRVSSARHGLDPALIRSMIAAESAGHPRAVSPKGAAGLMQIMPGTARVLGVADVFDPGNNVEAGTTYIRQLLDRYGHDLTLALAAYNAGPGTVQSYQGLPPYRETDTYIRRVITLFNNEKSNQEKTRP